MHVSPNVYLSRPHDVDIGAENLDEALAAAADGANRIVILSAYHGPDYIRRLLKPLPKRQANSCQVTLVFGVERDAELMQAREGLRKLKSELRASGYTELELKIYRRGKPFHTKLYHFRRGTQPIWFIGSANASSAVTGDRHELMIRLRGAHAQLAAYVAAIIRCSVAAESPFEQEAVVDLRSFFMNGALCYKPLSRLAFTFDTCRIESKHRRVLRERLAEVESLPHMDPQTEGFAFDLISAAEALGGRKLELLREQSSNSGTEISRLKFRHLAVETVYGYWLPKPWARELKTKAAAADLRRIKELRLLRRLLTSAQDSALEVELDRHLTGLTAFFERAGISLVPKDDYARRFASFVRVRREWLDDEDRLERMARRLHVERVPDIWNDPEGAFAFERSFFEDLSARLDSPGRTSQIIDTLRYQLGLEGPAGPDHIRCLLKRRLEEGVDDTFWTG